MYLLPLTLVTTTPVSAAYYGELILVDEWVITHVKYVPSWKRRIIQWRRSYVCTYLDLSLPHSPLM